MSGQATYGQTGRKFEGKKKDAVDKRGFRRAPGPRSDTALREEIEQGGYAQIGHRIYQFLGGTCKCKKNYLV